MIRSTSTLDQDTGISISASLVSNDFTKLKWCCILASLYVLQLLEVVLKKLCDQILCWTCLCNECTTTLYHFSRVFCICFSVSLHPADAGCLHFVIQGSEPWWLLCLGMSLVLCLDCCRSECGTPDLEDIEETRSIYRTNKTVQIRVLH